MDKSIIRAWVEKHLPLVEVTLSLAEVDDFEAQLKELNQLGEDIQADENVWNRVTGLNDITIDATPAALLRVFGWEISRACNDERGPFYWKASNTPVKFPECLLGRVLGMDLSQPGRCDDGQVMDADQL